MNRACLRLLRGARWILLLGAVSARSENGKLPLPSERHATASPIAMAVWLGSADEQGFALAHAAEAMGIPLFITRSLDRALAQPMTVLTGALGGRVMLPEVCDKLEAYLHRGGLLVLDDTASRCAQNLSGVKSGGSSRQRYTVQFDTTLKDPGFAHLLAEESKTIEIGNSKSKLAIPSDGLLLDPDAGARALAHYEDGSVALSTRTVGAGRVYTLGVGFLDLILRPQDNRDFDGQRAYSDHFEPSADVPQLILRDWYLSSVPWAIALDPTAFGRAGTLVMTHDVDYSRAVGNMLAYAKAEQARGVKATYFIQTKIETDYSDSAFFDAKTTQVLAQTQQLGGTIASHSVAHAYDFSKLPIGTGNEAPGNYRPHIIDGKTRQDHVTRDGTLSGEIRVSKALLENALPGTHIDAFRSGYLATNLAQWRVLEANGYQTDSSYSANDVMSSFPYYAMDERGFSHETSITEFPVLLADTVVPLTKQIPLFKEVLDKESQIHGVCVVLIHPDITAEKLETEIALLDHAKDRLWTPDLLELATFWRRRLAVQLQAHPTANGMTIELNSPEPLDGLTIDLGARVSVGAVRGAVARVIADGRAVVLDHIEASTPVQLDFVELQLKAP